MSSNDGLTNALARMDEEIHQQIMFMSSLCAKRNSILPIFRLPPEVLARIFILCATYYYENFRDGLSENIPAWVNVSYVCHHWRNIALGCPTLWVFHFSVSLRWTQELLLRSKQALLKITCGPFHEDQENHTQSRILQEVFKHSERIKELCLHLPRGFPSDNFSLHVPRLEKLVITVHGDWDWSTSITISNEDESPLRTLKLRDCYVPWSSLNLSRLRVLHLHEVYSPSDMTMVEFLGVLGGMKDLTVLHLVDIFPRNFRPDSDLDMIPKINLDRLTRLEIVAPLSAVTALLSCINTPSIKNLILKPQTNVHTSIDDYRPISSFVAQHCNMSGGWTFRSLTMSVTPPSLEFDTSEQGHSPNLAFQLTLDKSGGDPCHTMNAICLTLPLTHVQRLHIIHPMESAVLKTLLAHLDGLRYIKLSEGRMPDMTMLAEQTLVPALEVLELDYIQFTMGLSPGRSRQSIMDIAATRPGLKDGLTMTHCRGV